MESEHIGYLPRMKLVLRIQFLEYILCKMLPPIICIVYFDAKWMVMNCDPIPCNAVIHALLLCVGKLDKDNELAFIFLE